MKAGGVKSHYARTPIDHLRATQSGKMCVVRISGRKNYRKCRLDQSLD